MLGQTSQAQQIALSAAHAAWAGAGASAFASIVALTVAVWGAFQEGRRRRRLGLEQATAFAFGMVGAVEMIKPLVLQAQSEPDGEITRRRFAGVVDHALVIADAALAIQVFDMQMLRDAYLIRGALHGLRGLLEDEAPRSISHRAITTVIEPVLNELLDADDRFFAQLPAITSVRGIHERTTLARL